MTSPKPARIEDDVRVIRVPVQELTASAFAPFGEVSSPTSAFRLDFRGERASFCHVHIERRPLRMFFFARHLHTTQAYVPLGGDESILVVAEPSGPSGGVDDTDALPDMNRVAAFRLRGGVAVNLFRGTWHRTPMPLGPSADFMVLDRDGTLEDLDLVDLRSNFGAIVELDVK